MMGTLTDTVYACNGAMEDWAYGGGWDTTNGSPQYTCQPQSDLPFNEADYLNDQSTIRSAIYLVEASHMKSPPTEAYGDETTDGYIPRHMRLISAFVKAQSPYIVMQDPQKVDGGVWIKWVLNGCV